MFSTSVSGLDFKRRAIAIKGKVVYAFPEKIEEVLGRSAPATMATANKTRGTRTYGFTRFLTTGAYVL